MDFCKCDCSCENEREPEFRLCDSCRMGDHAYNAAADDEMGYSDWMNPRSIVSNYYLD